MKGHTGPIVDFLSQHCVFSRVNNAELAHYMEKMNTESAYT